MTESQKELLDLMHDLEIAWADRTPERKAAAEALEDLGVARLEWRGDRRYVLPESPMRLAALVASLIEERDALRVKVADLEVERESLKEELDVWEQNARCYNCGG